MSIHRWDAKRDRNEKAIVDALEKIGVVVRRISGEGVPDLLCAYRGRWLPVEVKTAKGKLKPAQEKLYGEAMFPIVRSVAEALALFGVYPA